MKSKRWSLLALLALDGFLPQSNAGLYLGSAANFAVLGASTVTSTGDTVLNGNLGVYSGTAITGFPPGIVNGAIYAGGTVMRQAQMDARAAYSTLAAETPTTILTGRDLGGLTLTPGVYSFSSSAQLAGILTLDAGGNSNARFDFQIGSTLTTDSASSVSLINGAQAGNVFWQVGTSATLGTGTAFDGTIIADQSITLNTRAIIFGRALALNGAVTLDNNHITAVPESVTLWPVAICASLFAGWEWVAARRRKVSRALMGLTPDSACLTRAASITSGRAQNQFPLS